MRFNQLPDTNRSGLYTLPAEHFSTLSDSIPAGFVFREVRLDTCTDAAAVLLRLGETLDFPEWYGANFDALNDCLTDPDWQPAPGHILAIGGLATLRHDDPEGFATLIEVLLAAAEERRHAGQPFWLLIDTPARGVPAFLAA